MFGPHLLLTLVHKSSKKNLIGPLPIHISRSTPKGFLNYFSNVPEYDSSYLSDMLL